MKKTWENLIAFRLDKLIHKAACKTAKFALQKESSAFTELPLPGGPYDRTIKKRINTS